MDGPVCLELHMRPHPKMGAAMHRTMAHALSVSGGTADTMEPLGAH